MDRIGVCTSAHSIAFGIIARFTSISYFLEMQTPPNLNDQHVWGGQRFRAGHPTSLSTTQGRTPREGHFPHPQVGVIASSLDSLFHPLPNNTVPSSYAYNLPDVPPHFHASLHSPFTCPLPYP